MNNQDRKIKHTFKPFIEDVTGNFFYNQMSTFPFRIVRCDVNETYYVEVFEYGTSSKVELIEKYLIDGMDYIRTLESFWIEGEELDIEQSLDSDGFPDFSCFMITLLKILYEDADDEN